MEYHQDDIAAAKEKICKDEENSFMQRNLQREVESGEPTLKKSLPGSDKKTQSIDVSVCMSIVHDEGQRSPVPSVMSLKSDQSMNHPLTFSEDCTKTSGVQTERPHSRSSVFLEQQDGFTLSFDDLLSSIHDEGRQSPVPSVMSMKSDQSMNHPLTFSEDCTKTSWGGVVVLCSACPRTACKFCLNCNASYCETHVRQHYRASALQEHKLVEATADLEQTCQQHYRRLEFFCKTDQTLVCALCLVREHRGHEIMELEENESLQSHKSQMASQKALPRPGPIMFTSVNPDSVSLRWGPPEGQTEPHTFRLTWKCEGDHDSVEVSGVKFKAEELIPGKKYEFTVATLMSDGSQSPSVFATTTTEIPQPDNVDVTTDLTSLSVTWSKPAGVDEVKYLLSLHSEGECLETLSLKSHKRQFPGLLMGKEYSISVSTVLKNGGQSSPVSKTSRTKVPVPEKLSIDSVTATSANLSWSLYHVMDENPHSFLISYQSGGTEPQTISSDSCSTVITGLTPGTEYTVSVFTKIKHGGQSQASTKTISTGVPVPEQLSIDSVTATSANLSWSLCHVMDENPHSFLISYHSKGTEPQTISTDSCSAVITGLRPLTEYTVSVITKIKHGGQSQPSTKTIRTAVPVPEQLTVVSEKATSAELRWIPPHGMDQTPHTYQISYQSEGTEPQTISTDSCSIVITGLKPGTDYNVSVCIQLKGGRMSEPITKVFHTEIPTKKFYTTVIGNTQGHHKPLKSLLIKNKLTEVETVEDCDNILAFCVIVSHVGTDMEAALKEVPGTKPAVLVVMHHTFDPDHVIPDTSRFVKGREITVIDILFHKDQGILRCQQNSQAVEQLQKEFRVSPISETQILLPDACTLTNKGKEKFNSFKGSLPFKEPWSLLGPSKCNGPRPSPVNNNSAAADGFHSSSKSGSSEKLKYCTLVSGNTLNSHEHFKKCLADKGLLQTEVSSVEQCDIVLVFCPVVSTFTSDTEKAFRLIPHGKPAVVVVMHHTFDTDYTSPENMTKNGTLVVHCLFFEDIGLLKCSKNDAAINSVAEWLWERFPSRLRINQRRSDLEPQEKQWSLDPRTWLFLK